MYLPELDYEYTQREITESFTGYEHRLKIAPGRLYDSKNLSCADYPLLSSRKRRGLYKTLSAPGGLLSKDALYYVDSATLYRDGEATELEGLSEGQKTLVSMGSYICIFPDKLYYNTADPKDRGSMEAYYSTAGAVRYSLCRADGTEYQSPSVSDTAPLTPENAELWIDSSTERHTLRQWSEAMGEWSAIETVYTKLSFISEGELEGLFSVHDGVHISGADLESINGDKLIHAVGLDAGGRDYIVIAGICESVHIQQNGTVHISRTVPELDHVCQCGNRLWGCFYGESGGKSLNELYCCALGDFKNWRQYMGLSTDSWTASVGSDGAWTGAVNYLGQPLFFKENSLHTVSISSTGAHRVRETLCRGVQRGSEKSLVLVNETLLYKSPSSVCAYQGGFPMSVSEALGEENFSNATAGAVGDSYYISMQNSEGESVLFVYDMKRGIWMKEDSLSVSDFATVGGELYALSGRRIYALLGTCGEKESFVDWMAETGLLYYQYPERKYLSRFNLRMQLQPGAQVEIYIEYDSSGDWEYKGRIRLKGTNTATLPIRPRRCDHMRIRLKGRGDFKLFSVAKLISLGSDI